MTSALHPEGPRGGHINAPQITDSLVPWSQLMTATSFTTLSCPSLTLINHIWVSKYTNNMAYTKKTINKYHEHSQQYHDVTLVITDRRTCTTYESVWSMPRCGGCVITTAWAAKCFGGWLTWCHMFPWNDGPGWTKPRCPRWEQVMCEASICCAEMWPVWGLSCLFGFELLSLGWSWRVHRKKGALWKPNFVSFESQSANAQGTQLYWRTIAQLCHRTRLYVALRMILHFSSGTCWKIIYVRWNQKSRHIDCTYRDRQIQRQREREREW